MSLLVTPHTRPMSADSCCRSFCSPVSLESSSSALWTNTRLIWTFSAKSNFSLSNEVCWCGWADCGEAASKSCLGGKQDAPGSVWHLWFLSDLLGTTAGESSSAAYKKTLRNSCQWTSLKHLSISFTAAESGRRLTKSSSSSFYLMRILVAPRWLSEMQFSSIFSTKLTKLISSRSMKKEANLQSL